MAMFHFWHLFLLTGALLCSLSQPRDSSPPFSRKVSSSRAVENPNNACDCYVVSGPDPGYFKHYRFYDFRHPGSLASSSSSSSSSSSPSNLDNAGGDTVYTNNATIPPSIHPSLANSLFEQDWKAENWDRLGSELYPIRTTTASSNVFLARYFPPWPPSHLVLRTGRFPNYTSAAEISTRRRNFFHCSLRVRLRLYSPPTNRFPGAAATAEANADPNPFPAAIVPPISHQPPSRGAVAGIFTYFSRHSESDIEILTKDPPNVLHYANQPDWDPATDLEIPSSHDIVTIPQPWTTWSTHRLDWQPRISRWCQDGIQQREKTYGVPTDPSLIAMNLWSNGGVWSGDIPVGAAVYLGIEWIELAYNTSEVAAAHSVADSTGSDDIMSMDVNYTRPRPPPLEHVASSKFRVQDVGQCNRVCRIDGVQRVGVPEVANPLPAPAPAPAPPRS